MKCKQSGPGFELVSPCPYPATITIAPWAPPPPRAPPDAETNVHPLRVSSYFISASQWWYLYSCANTMCMLCSTADAVSSGSCPILYKVLTLNVTICIVLLHLSKFCLCLSSVANFSNTGARALTSAERGLFFFTHADVGWLVGFYSICGVMVIVVGNGHGDTSSNPERDWVHFT